MLTNEQRNAMAAEVLPKAIRYARKMARRNRELREHLEDVATESVVRALNNYTHEVDSWEAFAMDHVTLACARDSERLIEKQAMISQEDSEIEAAAPETPMGGEIPLSIEAKDLPTHLFEAFKLHFIDGHSVLETSQMLGIGKEQLRDLHTEAAMHISGRTDAKGEAMLAELERLGSEMPMRLAA